MASIINADTSDGLKFTSDTSGEINLQSGGATIATVNSSGITAASGKVFSGDGSSLTGVGKILQVVAVTKTDVFSSTNTSFTDITGLSASITPSSASNKILVIVTLTLGKPNSGDAFAQLLRDSTVIGSSTGVTYNSFGSIASSYENQPEHLVINYLDSPSSTSSLTYKIQAKGDATSWYVNRRGLDGDLGGSSHITLMEVAG